MELAALVAGLDVLEISGSPGVTIRSLAYRTQDAGRGSLFFCISGTKFNGHDFAAQAVAGGAVAVVCERRLDVRATQVVVPSVRRAMALIAARFFDDPSTQLRVAAVTGTNGKTTTAHLMARAFEAAGLQAALLGTVVNRIGGVDTAVTLTTAQSVDLQRMFRQMVDAGDRACAMEASSHALSQDRCLGIDFDVVAFTNLTRDHLDYHADLDDYFSAKSKLFLPDGGRQPHAVAVVNVGDEWGRRLADDCRPLYGDDLWTYTVGDGVADDLAADAVAERLQLRPDGSSFLMRLPRLRLEEPLEVSLSGRFNVENALTATVSMLAIDVSLQAVRGALLDPSGVAGRFEAIRAGQPFTVLVDYAHTPDSLENVLRAARGICRGRLIVVFGCGGDRDRGKRPLMGAAAAGLADRVVVTSDNPRTEEPLVIIDEIMKGVPAGRRAAVSVQPDRRLAIGLALAAAERDDVVVIAGKGHESGQIIGDRRIPFDDREVAGEWLQHAFDPART